MGAHGKCYYHGGASAGPTDPSLLEGNDHAVGNPGGGPPELNLNAATAHGAFSSLDKLEARLSGDALHLVAILHWDAVRLSREHAPDVDEAYRRELAREYALLFFQEELATVDFFERGVGLEREETVEIGGEAVTFTTHVENPTIARSSALSARQHRIGDELRLFPVHWDD